jgi:hypothetical protein
LELDYIRNQETHCRKEAERPGANREAWLKMAAQWANIRQRVEASNQPIDAKADDAA